MRNFLRTDIPEAELVGIFKQEPRVPLLPPMGAEVWRNAAADPVVRQLVDPLLEIAASERDIPLPAVTTALYGEYHATGHREGFKRVHFERFRRLARAAVGLLLSEPASQGVWLRSLAAKLRDILDEPPWAFPSHVKEPSGIDPLMIDLCAAETANVMGEIVTMFRAVLPTEIVTDITERVRAMFRHYLGHHAEFVWTNNSGNWNAVCHQGILGAALALESSPDMLAKLLVVAKEYLPLFLSGFGADGGCDEGPAYWAYGFGAFAILNEQIETASRGELSLIAGDERISEIARYGARISLSNWHFVNFADCAPDTEISPRLFLYLGNRLNDDIPRNHGRQGYRELTKKGINLQHDRCNLLFLIRLLRDFPGELGEAETVPLNSHYFSKLDVIVTRAKDGRQNLWEFAAKGGNNSEKHNHNDCGSYLLNINGVRMAYEIGAGEYSRDYFGLRRYQLLPTRTMGHSLPIVNGCEQEPGADFAAVVLEQEMSGSEARFVVDLTRCYPARAQCKRLIRRSRLDVLSGRLTVSDQYELLAYSEFESAILTERTVVCNELPTILGEGFALVARPGDSTVFDRIEERTYDDPTGAPIGIRRIVMKPQTKEEIGEIEYTLELYP